MITKEKTRVIILSGGLGTRIKTLFPDLPKTMIPVNGKPFIEWVIKYFIREGFQDFIISLGHLSQVAKKYFRQRSLNGTLINTVSEPNALGTGGALLFVQKKERLNEVFIVSNGDSLILTDLSIAWDMIQDPSIDAVLIGKEIDDTSRYGSLKVTSNGTLLGFYEKRSGRGLINSGIYFFKHNILKNLPRKTPMSIEKDGFPTLLESGANIMVYPCKAPFIDIGTPESLKEAEQIVKILT